jgi:hypothetical protein
MITGLDDEDILPVLKNFAMLGYGKNTKNCIPLLECVGYDFPKGKYKKPGLPNTTIWIVSACGQRFNKKMGYDWIGDHFPEWKKSPKYKIYP